MPQMPAINTNHKLKVHNGFNDYGLINMGKSEILLFLYISLMVKENSDRYDVRYSDIIKTGFFGKISVNQMKETMNRLSKKLIQAYGTFRNREGKLVIGTFFTFILPTEENDADYFTVKIDSDLKEMLLSLTRDYTILDIVQMCKLKSPYSLKLYRKLKQFHDTGVYKVSLEAFYSMMGIDCEARTSNTIKRIIEPAIDELKELFPELSYTKSVHGQASRVTGFSFTWKACIKRNYSDEEKLAITNKMEKVEPLSPDFEEGKPHHELVQQFIQDAIDYNTQNNAGFVPIDGDCPFL